MGLIPQSWIDRAVKKYDESRCAGRQTTVAGDAAVRPKAQAPKIERRYFPRSALSDIQHIDIPKQSIREIRCWRKTGVANVVGEARVFYSALKPLDSPDQPSRTEHFVLAAAAAYRSHSACAIQATRHPQ
jgi:hypothetical protein